MLFHRGSMFVAVAALLWLSSAFAGEEATVTRIFDVRQITSIPADRSGPPGLGAMSARSLDLEGAGRFMGESMLFDEDEKVFTDEELLSEVNELISAGDREDGETIEIVHGRLYATLAPEKMRNLEALLEKISGSGAALLGIRAFFFEPAEAGSGAKAAIDDAEAGRMIEQAKKSGAWWDEMSLCGMENRRFHAVKGCQSTYLAEYDVEVASGSSMFDPVMSSLETGIMIEAKPSLTSDGGSCSLTLRVSCSFPAAGKGISEADTPAGKIQKPSLATSNLQTTAIVKTGGWILLSTSISSNDADRDGAAKGVAVLLKVEVLDGKAREGK